MQVEQTVEAENESSQRGLTLACNMGDIEFSWDPANDAEVRKVIQKKMDEGFRFFILKPLIGQSLHIRRRLTNVEDLRSSAVRIRDEDVSALWKSGHMSLFRSYQREENGPAARTADEALRNRTIGVPSLRGG